MGTQTEASWTEVASAEAGIATATRAGEGGNRHSVSSVTASFNKATGATKGLLTINFGATVVWQCYVYDVLTVAFPLPLRAGSGVAVTAVLAAEAAGVTGTVAISGYTS